MMTNHKLLSSPHVLFMVALMMLMLASSCCCCNAQQVWENNHHHGRLPQVADAAGAADAAAAAAAAELAIIQQELDWAEKAMENYKQTKGGGSMMPLRSSIRAAHVHTEQWRRDAIEVLAQAASRDLEAEIQSARLLSSTSSSSSSPTKTYYLRGGRGGGGRSDQHD